MPDDPTSSPPSSTAESVSTSGSSDWPSILIKNMGAIVAVVAAVIGIYKGLQELKLKAVADQQTAQFNMQAEADRLALGKAQLADQERARKDQQDIHNADNLLELTKVRMQIDEKRRDDTNLDAKNSTTALSALIGHMLVSDKGTEGDLAILFQYLGQDAKSTEIIENAVLAKLENPHSREEVDLGFRILEAIGPSALDYATQANRAARAKFDDCLFLDFYNDVRKYGTPTNQDPSGHIVPFEQVNTSEYHTASSHQIDHLYIRATITERLDNEESGHYRLPAQAPIGQCPQPYAEEIIRRSNQTMAKILGLGAVHHIDLSDTYLIPQIFPITAFSEDVDVDGAFAGYVPLDDLRWRGAVDIPQEGGHDTLPHLWSHQINSR